jgi:cytochrome c oxidase subunit 1
MNHCQQNQRKKEFHGSCWFSSQYSKGVVMTTHGGSMSTAVPDPESRDEHGAGYGGIRRWLFTTNHKDIGTLYLVFSLTMFFVGGVMALMIRTELFQPGLQIVDPHFFNQLTTMHGLVMIFGALMPAFVGLANWMIPMMIGAPDMALPRLNNWSFWLLPFGFALLLSTLFMPGGGPAGGWTMYPPLMLQFGMAFPFVIFAVHLLGISSVMGAINVITTALNLRAPGMSLMRLPLFVWTWLITAYMLILVMPVLAGAVTMLLTDKYFGTTFFSATGGGDPLMYQHIFWFFGHPEVYIMVLPTFGIISHIVSTFARKPLFGYSSMVYATASIAFLSCIVWAHHMFTTGMPLTGNLFFMFSTMLIAVPTGVKVFNWTATMWRGSLTFETPMLFAVGFIILFTIGGFSGLMVAIVPADIQYHDTYFVVAHFHYVLVPGSLFGIIGAVYFWLPKWTGHMYNERLGKAHFWMSAIFVNVLFFPQHFLGLAGMPRRIPDYSLQFVEWNMISTVGAFGFGLSQVIFLYIVIQCTRGGHKATAQVWEGAEGLEWTLPSPAPYHSFERQPTLEEVRNMTGRNGR